MSTSTLSPPDRQLETLAEQLLSHIVRTQNGGKPRGLYGEFTITVGVQDGFLAHFALKQEQKFKPSKRI